MTERGMAVYSLCTDVVELVVGETFEEQSSTHMCCLARGPACMRPMWGSSIFTVPASLTRRTRGCKICTAAVQPASARVVSAHTQGERWGARRVQSASACS